MNVKKTELLDCLIFEPFVFEDDRGVFIEQWNIRAFRQQTGTSVSFVQANKSRSKAGVLRGIHYQHAKPQGKLVQVLRGDVDDVVVDLRRSSETYGKHQIFHLSEEKPTLIWIPPGFGHGFLAKSNDVEFQYWVTDYYNPGDEFTIAWNDSFLNIPWAVKSPILSSKDQSGLGFHEAPHFD